MEYKEFSARSLEDAITDACTEFGVTSDQLDYEVIDEGSSGFLGMGAKPALIRAAKKTGDKAERKEEKKEEISEKEDAGEEIKSGIKEKGLLKDEALRFLEDVFRAMDMKVNTDISFDEASSVMQIELSGNEMAVLIGKRGQTLDSLQYLTSLVVNKDAETYIHVKLDTENYRERRKATLENLAKNIAYKVKKTRRPVSLEPMNPYERRIIHSALQGDRYVTTHSEGEDPYRKVVVTLKR